MHVRLLLACALVLERAGCSQRSARAAPAKVVAAARRGDDAAVLAWLDGGGRADATYGHHLSDGWWSGQSDLSLVMAAASQSHERVVDLLIQRGADVDLQSRVGYTALIIATASNQPAAVQRLLRAGADTTLRGETRKTALMIAKEKGYTECARANVEHAGTKLPPPLPPLQQPHRPPPEHVDEVRRILEGAPQNTMELGELEPRLSSAVREQVTLAGGLKRWLRSIPKSSRSFHLVKTAHTAADGSRLEVGDWIYSFALSSPSLSPPDPPPPQPQTHQAGNEDGKGGDTESLLLPDTIVAAAERGDEAAVLAWVDGGGQVNAFDSAGFTLLQVAASNGHERVVDLLLRRGAEINLQDSNGYTALMNAAGRGRELVVELLLQRGAEINQQSSNGGTALILAAGLGHERVIDLLVQRGAEIDLQSSDGVTALIVATGFNQPAVVQRLLRAGSDTTVREENGKTALMIAKDEGHTECARSLSRSTRARGRRGRARTPRTRSPPS